MAAMKVAFVGCGNIADRYAASIAASNGVELLGATDVAPGRADAFVGRFGGTAYPTLEALLADDAVETVVNLTPPQLHATVTAAGLGAGKHVHSEKPLALRYEEAQELVEMAARRGLRLSCAPATLLGEAQQTAWKLVRDGAIGRVRAVYAEANWGRIESWHPSPEALYAVGPLVDVGVYSITMVTGMLGPAQRVLAYATTLEPERVTLAGVPFQPGAPDFVVAVLELDGGVVVRVTASFYVPPSKQRGLELHGDLGSLYLATWAEFDSRLELAVDGGEYAPAPLLKEPYQGTDWGRVLVDLAEAVEEGRPHRATGEHAAHVVEILSAFDESVRTGGPVAIHSSFEPPQPLPWAV
jgi:predicted dehydrogenase